MTRIKIQQNSPLHLMLLLLQINRGESSFPFTKRKIVSGIKLGLFEKGKENGDYVWTSLGEKIVEQLPDVEGFSDWLAEKFTPTPTENFFVFGNDGEIIREIVQE